MYEKCVEQAIIDKNHKVCVCVCVCVCEAESYKVLCVKTEGKCWVIVFVCSVLGNSVYGDIVYENEVLARIRKECVW